VPDTGRNTTPPKARRRAKLSPLERYARGKRIAEMRSRVVNGNMKPLTWGQIGKEVGMSARGAEEAYATWLEWEEPLHDPNGVVDETINALTVSMHEALRTYEAAPEGSSVRVQALRTTVHTAITRLQVMRAAGRAPRSLAAPMVERQMQAVLREFAELLGRHEVGDDVLRDFLLLAESKMGQVTAIDARELPSAA
jgi:hypothetical protein